MQDKRSQTPQGQLWNSIQTWLFPMLEDMIGALDDKHRQFVAACDAIAADAGLPPGRMLWTLRAPRYRATVPF